MSEHYRPLTAPETLDWLTGYAWFPGAVETEHGVMVPELLSRFHDAV